MPALIKDLNDLDIRINYLKFSTIRHYNFKEKKTFIVSDKINIFLIFLIFFNWLLRNKSEIWFILWNGESDKKILAYRLVSYLKFATNICDFSPFYPSSSTFQFFPIGRPKTISFNQDEFFSNKVVFIGELYCGINDKLSSEFINNRSWDFANSIFNGLESIEKLDSIFIPHSFEHWVTINRIRYLYLKQLNEDLDNLILIGDDFVNLQFRNSLPTNHSEQYRHNVFLNSFINIDLLSKSTFMPIYPRSIECISLNKNLLQLRTNVFPDIFGWDNMEKHTFNSYDELKSKILLINKSKSYFDNSTLQECLLSIIKKNQFNLFLG